jgi:hypothetical protein
MLDNDDVVPAEVSDQNKKSNNLFLWQHNAIKFFFDNGNCALYTAATGTGKSRLGVELIKEVWRRIDDKARFLIVVPKNVILESGWAKELFDNGVNLNKVGIYYGKIKEYGQVTVTNMQNLPNIILDMFDGILIDECVTGDTKVTVVRNEKNGKKRTDTIDIKSLYKIKSKRRILSYNLEKQCFEEKDIESSFKSKEKREIYNIILEDGKKLSLTGNHRIYTDKGYKEVKNITGEEKILCFKSRNGRFKKTNKKLINNEDIRQVILSGFIGDGNCSVHPNGTSARMRYSSIKEDYLLLKKNILESGGESVIFENVKNAGFKKNGIICRINTKSYIDILFEYQQFKLKGIDYILDNLTDLGIALWLFDDGSNCHGSGFMLHCNRFCKHDIERICDFFNNKKLFCKSRYYIKKDGRGFYSIYFNKKGLQNIIKIMVKHCVPSMAYKIQSKDTTWKKYM